MRVKVRKLGDKVFWFLSSGGGLVRLRIHAIEFNDKERAGSVLAELIRDNPNYEGKVVDLRGDEVKLNS